MGIRLLWTIPSTYKQLFPFLLMRQAGPLVTGHVLVADATLSMITLRSTVALLKRIKKVQYQIPVSS
jgi:hypothetical protein